MYFFIMRYELHNGKNHLIVINIFRTTILEPYHLRQYHQQEHSYILLSLLLYTHLSLPDAHSVSPARCRFQPVLPGAAGRETGCPLTHAGPLHLSHRTAQFVLLVLPRLACCNKSVANPSLNQLSRLIISSVRPVESSRNFTQSRIMITVFWDKATGQRRKMSHVYM